jgi:hypothetical protein
MVDLVAAAMGGGAPERAALEEVRAGLDVKLARDEHGSARISFAVPPRELLARAFRGLAQVLEGSRSQDPRGDQAGRG